MASVVTIRPGVGIGAGQPLLVMAGPCVIESAELCLQVAREMKAICAELGLGYVFKASFDKANRTSINGFRGCGMDDGLQILARVKRELDLPIVTDIHLPEQAAPVAAVADILQIPAFLCRQTDLLLEAARTGRVVNVKKGQFLAPEDMKAVVDKVLSTGNDRLLLTERGTTFGYHNLVVDMRGLETMRSFGVPVVFDATHAVQQPGGLGNATGGRREFVYPLARAAAAVGIAGLFIEVHPVPDKALSDGPNSLALASVKAVLQKVKAIDELIRQAE